MNNQDTNNQSVIEDLSINASAPETLMDLSVDEATEAELIGGPTSVQWPYKLQNTPGTNLNHNETIAEDNGAVEAATAKLFDLTVDDETENGIKGGLLLPAVQKVREAAATVQSAHGSGGMGAGKVSLSDLS